MQSLALAPAAVVDRSLQQVSLLLARCFYLLAVCKTERYVFMRYNKPFHIGTDLDDSCWTVLGQAVRVAQSIGLHVEHEDLQSRICRGRLEDERRRRVWYSIYVLDRVLALQLGRPPAIHDDDYDVPLPSRISDSDIDWNSDLLIEDRGSSEGDYFVEVIAFSGIISRVLRSLYGPRRRGITTEGLISTHNLDLQLIEWKLKLPRTLRFDLGHAFENSYIYKRQVRPGSFIQPFIVAHWYGMTAD